MKIFIAHHSIQGQTSLEYLLLLAVVAVIVIASFGPGSLISKVHDSAGGDYNTVTPCHHGNGTDANPTAIPGRWCPVTCPSSGSPDGYVRRACECPAPAFGGSYRAPVSATRDALIFVQLDRHVQGNR